MCELCEFVNQPRRAVLAIVIISAVSLLGATAISVSDPGSPADYYSMNGASPKQFPSEDCLLTLCLGSPIDRCSTSACT